MKLQDNPKVMKKIDSPKKYILAILEIIDSDDGLISIKTGCINGNGKQDIAILNENNCIVLDKKFINFMLKNWAQWTNSPEYVMYKKLKEALCT
jgi:hypothetical protein